MKNNLTNSLPSQRLKVVSENDDALAVFERLNALFMGNQSVEFWEEYSELALLLFKSSLVVCFSTDRDDINILNLITQEEVDQELFIRQAVGVSKRVSGKCFAMEPSEFSLTGMASPFLLCFELRRKHSSGRRWFTALILDRQDQSKFNEMIVRSQLIGSIYESALNASNEVVSSENQNNSDELAWVLNTAEMVFSKERFLLACMALVNEISFHYKCGSVSLGKKEGDYFKLIAISRMDSFDKNSEGAKDKVILFEEACDQNTVVFYPGNHEDAFVVFENHASYQRKNALGYVLSLPFVVSREQDEPDYCLTIESDKAFTNEQIALLNILLPQVSPWVQVLYEKSLLPHKKVVKRIKGFSKSIFGLEHSMAKLITCSIFVLFVLSFIIKADYEVEAVTDLQTEKLAYLSAPYNGFIKNVSLKPGDFAMQGQVIATIDTEELELKRLQEVSNLARLNSEIEKYRSERKLVDMKVSMAKKKQSEIEIERINYFLKQANLVSPFDGIVVEGEQEELQGAPVNKGDLLLKIANPTGLYARVKLKERDIDDIEVGQDAELRLLSDPNQTYSFSIKSIIPLASVDAEDGNVFFVEAYPKGAPKSWWRPGMSGVIHIYVGERSLIWLALHRTLDVLRMKLWV